MNHTAKAPLQPGDVGFPYPWALARSIQQETVDPQLAFGSDSDWMSIEPEALLTCAVKEDMLWCSGRRQQDPLMLDDDPKSVLAP